MNYVSPEKQKIFFTFMGIDMAKLTYHTSFEDLKKSENSIHPAKLNSVKEFEVKELVLFLKNHLSPRDRSMANEPYNPLIDGK